jgi:hypothetical protein
VDAFFDHPAGKGALTAETGFIHLQNSTQSNEFVNFSPGDNAEFIYFQMGYLFGTAVAGGTFQPYFRFENTSVQQNDDIQLLSGGLHYYLKGHNAKVSLDYTLINYPVEDSRGIFTVQLAAGI